MSQRRAHGFSLIEVLLAVSLLAAGLALAFATLRAATAMVQRGESISARNEGMRAVDGFLRRRIGAAQPIAFATDPRSLRQYRFLGEPQRMRFVADLPDYLGRGGPYLHDLSVAAGGTRLDVAFDMVQAGRSIGEPGAALPEPLARDLQAVRFHYRGLDEEGRLGPWRDRWPSAEALPLQVQVEVFPQRGQPWPPLVVSLAHGSGWDGAATDMAPLP